MDHTRRTTRCCGDLDMASSHLRLQGAEGATLPAHPPHSEPLPVAVWPCSAFSVAPEIQGHIFPISETVSCSLSG